MRAALKREQEKIQRRIREIDAALGGNGSGMRVLTARQPRAVAAGKRAPAKRAGRAKNKMSIREAVAKVTAGGPLTVPEIVAAVRKIGYKFTSKDPVNSVGAFLYSARARKIFKNVNGRFSSIR